MELLSPADFHQYAPCRRAEEFGSQRPLQHVDRRPADGPDRPYRADDAVTGNGCINRYFSFPVYRGGDREAGGRGWISDRTSIRFIYARRDRLGKTAYRWG